MFSGEATNPNFIYTPSQIKLTTATLHQIDSTSLHLLFQRNFTLLMVINYQDFLYGISLPDIHLVFVFINDVLICQTLCPITLILPLP